MRDIALVILGWLLGLLAPGIAEHIRAAYQRKQLTRALIAELRELQLNLALVAWRLRFHLGTIDATLMTWLRAIADSYAGLEDDPDTLEGLRKFLSQPPEQMAAAATAGAESRRVPSRSPRVPPLSFPFLTTNTGMLSTLSADLQIRLWQIHNQLQIFNDQAALVRSQMDRTFDSSLSAENRAAIQENIDSGYGILAERAKRTADIIGILLAKYGSV